MPTMINVVPASVVESTRSTVEATGHPAHGFLLVRQPEEDREEGTEQLTLYGMDSQGVPVDIRSQASLEVAEYNTRTLKVEASGVILTLKPVASSAPNSTPMEEIPDSLPMEETSEVPVVKPLKSKKEKVKAEKSKEEVPVQPAVSTDPKEAASADPKEGLLQQTAHALGQMINQNKEEDEMEKEQEPKKEYGLKEMSPTPVPVQEVPVRVSVPAESSNSVVVFNIHRGIGSIAVSLPVTTYPNGPMTFGQPRCNN